ncbi:MAG: ECF-type sigma factor [Pseudomonadota bacterium]
MSDSHVTRLLEAVNAGSAEAQAELMEHIYDELRSLARSKMSAERQGHTLQPTVLVNEVYLRLAGSGVPWQNRAHFFGAAAEAMRRILIEHARKRAAQKRGGDAVRVTFSEISVAAEDTNVDLLALDAALAELDDAHPRLGKLVRLRYFAGASIQQTAQLLEISPATAKRDWVYARAWLYERMSAD